MMKKILKLTTYISIFILAMCFMGCDNDDDNLPEVIAGFTYTINIDTGTVTFINTSENSRTYVWDFGDGTSSTQINPIKTYENGTYTIVLKATNPAGGSNTFQDEITILIPEIATLPISFDGENTNYNAVTFGGASFEIVDNPDPSGTNTSTSKVGAVTNIGAQFEGFYFDLGSDLDLSTLGSVSMNFWAESPVEVLMKLEEGTAAPIETTASHGGTGWETIIFSFDSTDSYSRLTLFVDGPGTTAGTFYLDDITQVETPPDPCTEETEESLAAADFNLTFLSDPSSSIVEDGADFEWINNPDFENEVNKSCKVGQITKLGNNPWDNNQIDLDAKLDFNNNTGLKIKVWSSIANTEVRIKLEEIGNPSNNTEQFKNTSVTSAWEELEFPFTSADSDRFDKIVIFFDLNAGNTDTYYFDDLALYGEGSGGGGGGSFDDGLLTNGDFENGTEAWFGNALNVQTEGGNSFNFANVETAGQPFNVNLSQGVEIIQGKTYTLSFEASTDTDTRTMLAGIGLNEGDFAAATEEVTLTSTTQTFTLNLTAEGFGSENSRVLFDMGADTGVVVIDNVSLTCDDCDGGGGGGSFDDGLLTNGDFETGEAAPWFGNAANVQTEGGNSFNFANVETAGQPFNVNLSQVVEIIQGKNYTLSFDASTDTGTRTMLAGIGLNEGDFAAATEEVTLTSTSQTFSLNLSADGFGSANSRVLFDMGADTGVVVIDNVSLFCDDCDSGGGGGTGDNIATNGDFETGDDTGWFLFPNGGSTTIDNSINNGGSWSGKIVVTDSGGNPGFKQERIGGGTVAAGDVVQIKFDVIGTVNQPGAVVNVLLFGEGSTGVSFTHVFNPGPAVSGSWTTFTGTYTIPGGTDVADGISFLIEGVCGAVAGCGVDMNIDNVSVILNPQ